MRIRLLIRVIYLTKSSPSPYIIADYNIQLLISGPMKKFELHEMVPDSIEKPATPLLLVSLVHLYCWLPVVFVFQNNNITNNNERYEVHWLSMCGHSDSTSIEITHTAVPCQQISFIEK